MNEQDSPPTRVQTTRRRFLKLATGVLGLLTGIVMGIPLIGSLGFPASRVKKGRFAKAAEIDALPAGQPDDVTYVDQTVDAYMRQTTSRSVWAVKHSESDVTVFSPICPHLGCRYNWNPQSRQFECPCHGSIFSLDGKVVSGPSPRPLDTLPIEIENGEMLVEWEQFKLGIPDKTPV